MSYITKKPEKLASAIYLITSFFSDQEPLKWRLRNLASELASLSLYLKDNFSRDRERVGFELRTTVLEIITLFNVARNSGLISDMNHEIVSREMHKYLNSIGLPIGITEDGGNILLSSNFFSIESSPSKQPELAEPNPQKDISTTLDAGKKSNVDLEPESVFDERQTTKTEYLPRTKDFVSNKISKDPKPSNSKDLRDFGTVAVKKNARQSIIINMLKRKKEIMIKDVSPLIHNCSEKTIQRELLAMVKAGILKKEGEKRWSKYSLA